MKKHKNTNFRGITLIALVVTIVVLLILAGISISMLGGENGIIKQAVESKDKTKTGDEKERVDLAATSAKIENNWGEITEENLVAELTQNIGERDVDYKLTTNGEIPQEELTWLKNELENNKNNIIIICTHVPIIEPFSSANHKLLNDNQVYMLLRKYDNPILILQGHYHTTKIKQHKNIIAISTPSLVTYPNAFRVVNINNNKKRTLIDIYLKETNLKEIQTRSKLRILGTERLYGEDCDRNINIEIRKDE